MSRWFRARFFPRPSGSSAASNSADAAPLTVRQRMGRVFSRALLVGYGYTLYKRNYSLPNEVVLHLNLDTPLVDSATPSVRAVWQPEQTLSGIVQALDRAKDDPRVVGIVSGMGKNT